MGIGDWGLGIGDWGLGPIPNPQSPIPNPHFLFINKNDINFNKFYISNLFNILYIKNYIIINNLIYNLIKKCHNKIKMMIQ